MARFLLDTNVISELVRNPRGPAGVRAARMEDTLICTSIIVAAELRYGAAKKSSRRLAAEIESILARFSVLRVESPADVIYAELRTHLEAIGKMIGANDLLIASHAIALGCTLVTDNEREFSRVPGLALQNWLR